MSESIHKDAAGSSHRADNFLLALLFFCLIVLVIRISIRDSIRGLDVIFYLTPIPVVGALLAFGAVVHLFFTRRWPGLAVLACSLVLVFSWVRLERAAAYCPPQGDALRVQVWNIGRGRGGWDKITSRLRTPDADIIGIVEGGYHYPDPKTYWRRLFEGYDLTYSIRGMVVLVRGEVVYQKLHGIGGRSYLLEMEAVIDGSRLRVLLVDMEANLFLAREKTFSRTREIYLNNPGLPTIVMGDFNTPGESVWFERYLPEFHNSYDQVPSGFRSTWPSLLPIVEIDRILIDDSFVVRCTERYAGMVSDHTQIWADVSIP